MDDFALERFVAAQDPVYDQVRTELARGRKTSHWMWFVFPQLRGLGSSPTAQRYGISGLAEARGYLSHAVLGPRLAECTATMLTHRGTSVGDILGGIDAMKLRSSMTLFAAAADDPTLFNQVLDTFFAGNADERTLHLLADS